MEDALELSIQPVEVSCPITAPTLPVEHKAKVPIAAIPTPIAKAGRAESEPKMVTVMLDTSGDRTRDALRMRRVHGLLNSYPGSDRFAFLLFEASHRYILEFPSSSTGYCAELHAQLVDLVGEHRLRIETLRYQ
jgi:DNA polymerase-3 subunit alpha